MERKKLVFVASVSASVLLVSSLLVACAVAGAAGPEQGAAVDSALQAESESVSWAASSAPASSQSTSGASASQSTSAASSSSSRPAASSSQPPPASSVPSQSAPQQAAPQAQPPASQPECVPEPPPAPAPEPAPPAEPPPASSVNIDTCLKEANQWAADRNMTVNGNLYIGGAGHENPIDTNGKTNEQVKQHLEHQLGLIHGQLVAMPEYDPGMKYPCYRLEVVSNLIYVLYG